MKKLRKGLQEGVEQTKLAMQSIAPTDLSLACLLDPKVLNAWLLAEERQHLEIVQFLTLALDQVLIQRSQASTLPALKMAPISLKNLFKEVRMSTANALFFPYELATYQMLHLEAAR